MVNYIRCSRLTVFLFQVTVIRGSRGNIDLIKQMVKMSLQCPQPLLSSVPCLCLCVSLISYTEQYMEYDPFVTAPEPSNPWTSDDPSLWDLEARYETKETTAGSLSQPVNVSSSFVSSSFLLFFYCHVYTTKSVL